MSVKSPKNTGAFPELGCLLDELGAAYRRAESDRRINTPRIEAAREAIRVFVLESNQK